MANSEVARKFRELEAATEKARQAARRGWVDETSTAAWDDVFRLQSELGELLRVPRSVGAGRLG